MGLYSIMMSPDLLVSGVTVWYINKFDDSSLAAINCVIGMSYIIIA